MQKKVEINTMISRNVYSTESFDFVKKVFNKVCQIDISDKPKEIHKQNKPFDYTDELRIFGTSDRGIKYHSYYKASEKEMRKPTLFTVSSESFGCPDFWIKFTISSQDGLILELNIKDDNQAQEVIDLFEAEFGYCRKQSQDEIFDELLHEIRTRGAENNGAVGIKLGLKAIKIFSDDFWARFYLGCSYALNNQHQKAIDYLTLAIKIDPKSYDAYYNLGKSYLQLNDLINAKNAMIKALALAEQSHAISYYLALIHEKMGDKKEAEKYYELAIKTAPENLPQEKRVIKSFLEDAQYRLEKLQE